MRKLVFSTITVILTILCMSFTADTCQAAAGGLIRTIPSPTPAQGYSLGGATFANGMLIVVEQNNTPALPSKFHKIDPADGTVLETVDLPFGGFLGGVSFDGTNLWICRWYSTRTIFEVGLDGTVISQFSGNVYPYFRAYSVNCEDDHLWVIAYATEWFEWTRLFKMTKTGEVIEWYSTTDILPHPGDGEIDPRYPTGSNLFVTDNPTGSSTGTRVIKRLSIEGGTAAVVDEFVSPAEPDDKARGLAFDGENLWLSVKYPSKGKMWCLSDGFDTLAPYKIEQTTNGGYNPWIKGQTFTPSIGIDPDPGPVATLDLKAVTFYRSSQGWAGPTSEFYLNIYDGDPVNGMGTFIGSSVNAIDVEPLGDFYPMTWVFDNLTLDYGHTYWALVSSTSADGGLDVYCGMRECGPDLYAGGSAIAGISGDPYGYHVKGNDLAFEIGLDLSGPAPDIKVNGEDGPLTLTTADDVAVTIHLDPKNLDGDPADWWLYAERDASSTWWAKYRSGQKPKWTKSVTPMRFAGATLRTVGSYTVLGPRPLPAGDWVFGFAVDDNQDGIYDASFFDAVEVTVN